MSAIIAIRTVAVAVAVAIAIRAVAVAVTMVGSAAITLQQPHRYR